MPEEEFDSSGNEHPNSRRSEDGARSEDNLNKMEVESSKGRVSSVSKDRNM